MDKNLHDIDKLFTDGIDGYEEMPSSNVWEGIDHTLDKHGLDSIKKKYKNLKTYSAIVITGLIALLVYKSSFLTKKLQFSDSATVSKAQVKDSNNLKIISNENAEAASTVPLTKDITEQTTVHTNDNLVKPTPENKEGDKTIIQAGITPIDNHLKTPTPIKETPAVKIITNTTTNEKVINKRHVNAITVEQEKGVTKTLRKQHIENAYANNANAINVVTNNTNSFTKNNQLDNTNAIEKAIEEAYNLRLPQSTYFNKAAISYNSNQTYNTIQLITSLKPTISTEAMHKKASNKRSLAFLKPQISIMPYAAYESTNREIEDNPETPTVGMRPRREDDWKKVKQHEEEAIKTPVAGAKVEFLFLNKVSLTTGVGIASQYNKIKPKLVETELGRDGRIRYRFDCSAGSAYITAKTGNIPLIGDSALSGSSNSRLRYMQVPLLAGFHLQKNKFSFTPFIGATANILLDKQLSTEITYAGVKETQTVTEIEGLQSIYYTTNEGVTIGYKTTRRLSLQLTPYATQALSSMNKNAVVKSFPNGLGIQAGLKINLK